MPPALIIIIIIGGVGVILAAAGIFSRLYFKRSLMATLAEFYLKITEKKQTDEEVIAGLPRLPERNDVPLEIPKKYRKGLKTETRTLNGMQIFLFHGGNADIGLVYLHGAGYVRPPRPQHWKFAYNLAKRSGATVYFTVYPKAPNHDFQEGYELVTKLYREVRKTHKKALISGDSSGGGLALGLAEDFLLKGIPQPDKLILLSPWVDITLENPDIPRYERTDPIVCASNERIWGKSWANGADLKGYRVSPIYGSVEGICPVVLFVGTREALYPDVMKLAEKLKASGAETTVYVGEGLNHVYPIYPIPEARKALGIISKIIQKENGK